MNFNDVGVMPMDRLYSEADRLSEELRFVCLCGCSRAWDKDRERLRKLRDEIDRRKAIMERNSRNLRGVPHAV